MGPAGTGTEMSEVTKKAAVSTATRGISSSRMRQAPKNASPAAATSPPIHQGSVSTPSGRWTAQTGKGSVADRVQNVESIELLFSLGLRHLPLISIFSSTKTHIVARCFTG